jgi:hypothetical protein
MSELPAYPTMELGPAYKAAMRRPGSPSPPPPMSMVPGSMIGLGLSGGSMVSPQYSPRQGGAYPQYHV